MDETGEIPVNIEAVKPKVLYHASSNREITVLEPRAETVRDKKEGLVVFATPSKTEASKFIVPSDDTWTRKMNFGDISIHVIGDRNRYEESDKGGTIYHLSPEAFETEKEKGRDGKEWTSKVSVTPIGRDDYESGLLAQLENGVQVYFVDKETFDLITKSGDHGNLLIRSLESENKRRNINYQEVPSIADK